MSDSRGIGQGPRFSEIYQQYKSDVPLFQDREHVRANGDQLYLRSSWDRLTTTEPEQERQERLQAGANCIREAIDREYGSGVADAIFARLSSAGVDLSHEVTRGDLELIHGQINKLLDDAEHVRGYGDQIVLLSGQDRRGNESPQERKERWQAGSDHVRQAIDREHGPGLGSAIFYSLSRSAGHDLHQEVTRGDLAQIDSVLGRRTAIWNRVTASTYDATSKQIESLVARGFPEGNKFAKELAELRDNVMWGATEILPSRWSDLRKRVDEADRKSNPMHIIAETNRKIALLEGWTASTGDAQRLKSEFKDVRAGAAGNEKAALDRLQAFDRRVTNTLNDWGKVHRHNAEIWSLSRGDDTWGHIDMQVRGNLWEGTPEAKQKLTQALKDVNAAKTKIGRQEFDTFHANELDGLRANVKSASETLRRVYEESVGGNVPDSFIHARRNDLLQANQRLLLRAAMVPDATEDVVALQEKLKLARKEADNPKLSASERYEYAKAVVSIAEQLVGTRTQSVTSTQSGGGIDTSQLDRQAVDLTQRAGIIATLPKSGVDSGTRSDEALKAVNGASDQVLARLGADAKLSLLESLLATDNVPKSSAETKNDPLRIALRKLYAAIALDPAFIKQDNALREKAVDTLIAKHGKEFQFYRDNWSAMTQDQRRVALTQVLEAHCGAMGVPLPTLAFSNAPDNGSLGHYDPKTKAITIATTSPAFNDFESMIDTIFHENTHHYQNVLPDQANNAVNKEFPTQVKIFEANMRVENAYIKGAEDLVDYKRQPVEAHAWRAGGHATSLLLQRLDALRV